MFRGNTTGLASRHDVESISGGNVSEVNYQFLYGEAV
jgi:hypothetical protein